MKGFSAVSRAATYASGVILESCSPESVVAKRRDSVQKHYGVPPSGMGGSSGRLYVYDGLCFIYGCCFVGCDIAKTGWLH